MIGFVANVYVSTYLKATERLNPDLEAKAKKVIAAGNIFFRLTLILCRLKLKDLYSYDKR